MPAHGAQSLWRDTGGMDAARARELAAQLDLRGKAADEVEARTVYLGLLGVAAGERVLDIGCGSGVVTREIARRVGAGGGAVGVDTSPALLEVARDLADAAGLGDRVEFREGSALQLPFPDGTFDAAIAATVLSHVPGAERAIPEMARVVRPGGRVGVFDFDGDTFVITHPDRPLTRRIVAAASDAAAVNGWLVRHLPRLFAEAGIEDVQTRGFMPLQSEPGSFYVKLAERYASTAAAAGAVSEAEGRAWIEDLRAAQARGPVIAGRLHVFVWGRRPAR